MHHNKLAERICAAYKRWFGSELLSEVTVRAMEELGSVLKPIYLRMKKEGWVLKDGKMIKQHENEE